MVTVEFSISRLPPLLRHVGLGAQGHGVLWPSHKSRKAKKVPAHGACRVSIGQEWGEPGSSVPNLVNFSVA